MTGKRNYSRAELAARNRYNAKTYEALTIRGRKGWRNIVKAEAERQHERKGDIKNAYSSYIFQKA